MKTCDLCHKEIETIYSIVWDGGATHISMKYCTDCFKPETMKIYEVTDDQIIKELRIKETE